MDLGLFMLGAALMSWVYCTASFRMGGGEGGGGHNSWAPCNNKPVYIYAEPISLEFIAKRVSFWPKSNIGR